MWRATSSPCALRPSSKTLGGLCSRIPVSQIFYSLSEVKTPRHLLLSASTFPARPAVYIRACISLSRLHSLSSYACSRRELRTRIHTYTHTHRTMGRDVYVRLVTRLHNARDRYCVSLCRLRVHDANARYPLLSAMLYTGLIETPMIPRRGKGERKGRGFLFLSRCALFFGEITPGWGVGG